ncbi:MAG: hypothetical protein JSR44_08300 [Spirochaetes bacterium]|nr:hypothetical protein [Spirochaetota bacterium]
MQRFNLFAVMIAGTLMTVQCSSSKSSVMKDANGRVIGRYDTLSDSEARASFDANQNGVNERVATYRDKKISTVEYFDDKTGAKTKAVNFNKDGKPEIVQVLDKNGKDVRGDVKYDVATSQAKEVNLPAKGKKVIFNGDGTVSVTNNK